MRPWAAVAHVLFALFAASAGSGCTRVRSTVTYAPANNPNVNTSVTARLAPPVADGGHRVTLQTRLIEQPAGDEYLTHGLWKAAADPLSHEHSTRLAVNGLRVGVVSGQLPGELERLASSDSAAVNPMLRTFLAGQPKAVPVNGPLPRCAAAVRADLSGDPAPKTWQAADCGVVVTATPLPDGRLSARIEFQVQHGERTFQYHPNSDGTAFDGRHQRTVEAFPTLAFEVTLRRGDVLLFGATDAPAGTLGQAFFFPPAADRLRQRVLMVQPFAPDETARPPRSAALVSRPTTVGSAK